MDTGRRIRELREARHLLRKNTGFSLAWLFKVEHGDTSPSLGAVERLCEYYGIGLARFFGDWTAFQAMLALEDEFVLQVREYVHNLSETDRKLIIKTLEAAPHQVSYGRRGRPRQHSGHSLEHSPYDGEPQLS